MAEVRIAPTESEALALAAFEAVMRAMAEPGRAFDLPEPGPACIACALIDGEVRAHAAEPGLAGLLAALGARAAAPETAEYVFATATPDLARRLRGGTLTYPEAGATLVAPTRLGVGPGIRLTGPGIETERVVRVGLDPDFWAARTASLRYPLGFDLMLHDGAVVLAVPRSTRAEAC